MNRKFGFGALALMVALTASFAIPEDADAFGRRNRRRGGGGCHGGYSTGHQGYSNGCATGGCETYTQQAAPIASNCNNCSVGQSGNWSAGQAGGYSAGYGQSVMGGQQGQPDLNNAPQAPQGPEAGATFRRGDNGADGNATRSPSDGASAPRTEATNDGNQAPGRSAPPPAPSSDN